MADSRSAGRSSERKTRPRLPSQSSRSSSVTSSNPTEPPGTDNDFEVPRPNQTQQADDSDSGPRSAYAKARTQHHAVHTSSGEEFDDMVNEEFVAPAPPRQVRSSTMGIFDMF